MDASTEILNRVHFDSDRVRARIASGLAAVSLALSTARRPYIAFSGGKDSLAVCALVERLGVTLPLVWSDDELEYPETVAYMERVAAACGDQLTVTLGHTEHAGWFRPWQAYPYWRQSFPGALRIGRDMDGWAREQGYDLVLLGLRMEENRRRRDWLRQTGGVWGGTTMIRRCAPLWDWSADDVWALIAGWELPYNTAYDVMERIGMPRRVQRVGPLPEARRHELADGWPALLERLETRYGPRWP